LSSDIINIIGHGSTTIFKGVILLIFEKALDEPKYSSMYAQLCKRLAEHTPNFESPDSKTTTFKHLLLSKCRDEFKNRAAVSGAFDKYARNLTVEEEEARFTAKRKMLGNIKFIGELGKLEMLHDSILHRCCEQLLVGRKKQPIHEQSEDLECLAHLFKTCGRILDTEKAKLLMDQYFDRIRAIIANADTPTRIKFLLQDVIDLRENRWTPRKLASPDGPRTIQQVREDAARDGCIYLPQQDTNLVKAANNVPSHLQEVLFSKSRNKGMEDIFGGPGGPATLGTGPGVIGGEADNYGHHYHDNYHHHSHHHHHHRNGGPSFEEKFNANNSSYRDDSRDHRDFKPKRDSFENKFAERPDFGDRFTANRNRTHPSNRGRGGPGGGNRADGLNRPNNNNINNAYDHRNGATPHHNGGGGDKDLPPRFKKMGGFSDRGDNIPLRPAAVSSSNNASMMLKPRTPSALPKSALEKLEGGGYLAATSSPKLMMSPSEPAVFISKVNGDKKRGGEKKNQGPTREEVFGKIEEILRMLWETGSTNEAFTAWKEGEFPSKMVNNALIHLFKQVVKREEGPERLLALQLVDQLCGEDCVTQTHCKEGLSRLVQNYSDQDTEAGLVDLAVWSLTSDKIKLVDLAEMTEGGSTFPLFFAVLHALAAKDENEALALFKEGGSIKLLDQLPHDQRTEEQLGSVLEERKLSFLVPLLTIKAELWRQLAVNPEPEQFLAWIRANVAAEHQTDPAFVSALMAGLLRYITERTTLAADDNNKLSEKEATDAEKDMILGFKTVLQAFLKRDSGLQLTAIYALQVYCFTKQFPKGLLLRWFVALYETDIIEEHAFLRWKEDVNDTYPGKGKALFQVNQWLTWLEEAESEEEEDDDE